MLQSYRIAAKNKEPTLTSAGSSTQCPLAACLENFFRYNSRGFFCHGAGSAREAGRPPADHSAVGVCRGRFARERYITWSRGEPTPTKNAASLRGRTLPFPGTIPRPTRQIRLAQLLFIMRGQLASFTPRKQLLQKSGDCYRAAGDTQDYIGCCITTGHTPPVRVSPSNLQRG